MIEMFAQLTALGFILGERREERKPSEPMPLNLTASDEMLDTYGLPVRNPETGRIEIVG